MLIRVHNLASDPDPTLLNYQKLSSWKVLEIENVGAGRLSSFKVLK